MSFSTKVKNDLCRVDTSKECCAKAEFVAFFLINVNDLANHAFNSSNNSR